MLGYIVRGLIVALIFGAFVVFIACEIDPGPRSVRIDAGAQPVPDADTRPRGYFGTSPVGWE